MSFIYSQALVAAFSLASCSGVDASVPSSESPTPKPCLWHDRTTGRFPLSRFGMTCAPLTEGRGAELLTWCLAAFPARTSALRGGAQASTASAADSGQRWQGSFAKWDREKSSWRTPQCSLLGDSDEFSETWPRWGSMRNGVSYLRPIPALRISESASGLWPTPTCDSATDRSSKYAQGGTPLTLAVKLWPIPTASLADKGGRVTSTKGREGGTLIEALSARTKWPAPCASASASASKGSSPTALVRKDGKSRENDRIDHAVMASDGGQLNPEWVEWLMGWPIGHTALKPLETAKYQEWLQQHGICWADDQRAA